MTVNNPLLWSSVSIDEIAEIMKELGYRAEIKGGGDQPFCIASAAQGWSFLVEFYPASGVSGARFTNLRFVSFFSSSNVSIEDCNNWNVKERFISAAIDSEGDTILQWDLVTKGGSAEMFEECFAHWQRCLGRFSSTVISNISKKLDS